MLEEAQEAKEDLEEAKGEIQDIKNAGKVKKGKYRIF